MNVIKQLLGSKKAIAGVATVIVNLVVGFMPEGTLDTAAKQGLITAITSIAAAYLIGQGVADHGKEAKKLDAPTALTAATPEAPTA